MTTNYHFTPLLLHYHFTEPKCIGLYFYSIIYNYFSSYIYRWSNKLTLDFHSISILGGVKKGGILE